jgi:hypothetical protein
MPAPLQTWQYRTLTGAASTISLATSGGAVLGGLWISSKTATGFITAFDTASTTPTLKKFIASTLSLAKGRTDFGPIETGTGLQLKTASIVGCVMWRPTNAGGN